MLQLGILSNTQHNILTWCVVYACLHLLLDRDGEFCPSPGGQVRLKGAQL